ncbi:MAG: cytochrome C oxidase subunit IV family protein [Planctomycetes bacterium]|nr:cytochrome C oxidase subunit IV family protein [Planctomycetota bacterium]
MNEQNKIIGYDVYIFVWLCLFLLTAVTVAVAAMDFGGIRIVAALFIASLKSSLVLYYFMHLKHENSMFKYMFLIVVAIIAIIVGFTFFDVSYR